MNPNRLHNIKRTAKGAAAIAVGVGALAVVRDGSGGGNESAKPETPTHIVTITDAQAEGISPKYQVVFGTNGIASKLVANFAKAEGLKLDAPTTQAGVEKDSAVIAEKLSGDASGTEIEAGQKIVIAPDGIIKDPQALNPESNPDFTITQIG